jgi:histone deacetylase complex regulatory component SIN3
LTIDDPVLTADKTWVHYLETYTLGLPTEGLHAEVRGPLLDKNREATNEAASRLPGKSDLAVRVGFGDYKLSYVSQTEETIFKPAEVDTAAVEEANQSRKQAWEKWLSTQHEGEDQVPQEQEQQTDIAVPTGDVNMEVDVA